MIIKNNDSSLSIEDESRYIEIIYSKEYFTATFYEPINNAFTSQTAKANVGEKIFIYIQD